MIKGIAIAPDQEPQIKEFDDFDLTEVQEYLGGHPAPAYFALDGRKGVLFLDDDGRAKRLPTNRIATRFAQAVGFPDVEVIVGPVVIFGGSQAVGVKDVPDSFMEKVEEIKATL